MLSNILANKFYNTFGLSDGLRFFSAPGRVNIIGEHIDYCGGLVMPVALSKVTNLCVRPNNSRIVRMAASDMPGKIFTFSINDIEKAKKLKWGNYQAGIFNEFKNLGADISGMDMYYETTVPFGAGLSSSASIELATAVALNNIFKTGLDGIALALLSQRCENTFCGVNCGIMDQFASSMGKKNHAIMLNCSTLEYKYLPLDLGDYVLVLANTKAKHSLGTSKYNERRKEADMALSLLQTRLFKNNLCDYTPEEFVEICDVIEDKTVRSRAEHIIFENERVKEAAEAMSKGEIDKLGYILHRGNQSIRFLYEATGPELDAMYDSAKNIPCCIGSRMTGGGFGGCTVNIVLKDKTSEFISVVGEKYKFLTGITPEFYVCDTGDGAREL